MFSQPVEIAKPERLGSLEQEDSASSDGFDLLQHELNPLEEEDNPLEEENVLLEHENNPLDERPKPPFKIAPS